MTIINRRTSFQLRSRNSGFVPSPPPPRRTLAHSVVDTVESFDLIAVVAYCTNKNLVCLVLHFMLKQKNTRKLHIFLQRITKCGSSLSLSITTRKFVHNMKPHDTSRHTIDAYCYRHILYRHKYSIHYMNTTVDT